MDEVKGGTHFSVELIPNIELERELLGCGEGVKVLSPYHFARRVRRRIRLMCDAYPDKGHK